MVDRESRHRLYRWLGEDAGTVVTRGVGGRIGVHYDEDRYFVFSQLSEIEDFVDDVLESELHAYRIGKLDTGQSNLVMLPLAKHLNAVERFPWSTPTKAQYSVRVQLFVDCRLQLALCRENLRFIQEPSLDDGKKCFDRFNDLISLIRVKASESEFRKALYDRERAAARNALSATRYIERLWRCDPGLQVVALELLYKDVIGRTCSGAKQDITRFLNSSRRKPTVFTACVGYVWILRWDSTKGWHFYTYFFFAGPKRQAETARAADIGNYWETVATAGQRWWLPRYFTILKLQQGDRIRSTIREVRNALESDMCFRVKPTSGGRCFGRGEEAPSSSIARR